jgi:ankyrin repeat protein
MSPQLPDRANLEHLRNEAKQRLRALRAERPAAQLADAQRLVARDYGFPSWRALKAAVDAAERERVFTAAAAGDVDAVRRALQHGFHPGTTDGAGRSVHQIAKRAGHTELELLMREHQERDARPADVRRIVAALHDAAAAGHTQELRRLLDAHPELLDARGNPSRVPLPKGATALHAAAAGNHAACVWLLLDAGAAVDIRDYGDNASALHFAAQAADLEIVRALVEAGADVNGDGDDHQLGVLGWATCLGRVRDDVAAYLLDRGARLSVWTAIALGREADVRRLVEADRTLLTTRMSGNEHRRTPLHHAAALGRVGMVKLLLDLGADVHAADAAGATAFTVAALDGRDTALLAMLEGAGATLDVVAALALGRHDAAARLLAADPARLGPGGRDALALHVLVARRDADAVRWLLAHGAQVNAKRVFWDCNATPLHVTAEHGLVDVARVLLDAGADPAIRDDKYEATALGWAEYCDQPAIAALLRERGATC